MMGIATGPISEATRLHIGCRCPVPLNRTPIACILLVENHEIITRIF